MVNEEEVARSGRGHDIILMILAESQLETLEMYRYVARIRPTACLHRRKANTFRR